jgi:acetoin utilization deacetylase AcuC-like enzyme
MAPDHGDIMRGLAMQRDSVLLTAWRCAMGAAHAQAYSLDQVAIVNFDINHGNGTEIIFHTDDRVLLYLVSQHPFYPDTSMVNDNRHIIHAKLNTGA